MPVKIADFIEAPNSGGNYKKVLLVVHLTISPEVKGAARGVVAYWRSKRTGSTQYVVDNAEIIQAVRETAYPWAAGTTANKWGIHVEHCGMLQTLRQWRDEYSSAELELSAPLFAELAEKYGIPIRWLTPEQIRQAVATGDPADGGICTHADITKAFPGETSHTDPGQFFPKGHFLDLVKQAAKSAPKPKPKPIKRKGITIGTHNLHDDAGTPTLFADALFFTEAIAPTIRARVKARFAHAKIALSGYRIVRADENPTVVIAVKRRLFKVTGKEWHRAHGGKAGLTPARGTLLVRGVMRGTGQPVSFLAEHRINDSWKTGARELPFRKSCWRKHTDLTKRLAEREIAAGRTVFAGGDMNTVKSMSGYEGVLSEAGHALDRLGVSPDMHISKAEVLSRRGSDHPRVRATVTPKEKA